MPTSSAPKRSPASFTSSLLLLLGVGVYPLVAQTVTTPQEALGFRIGDDYQLATYSQLEQYWAQLARESPRMVVDTIGPTAEGRSQVMAILTAPENHRRLERYRDISRQLAMATGLTGEQARALAQEGKAVVWIDGGLHATEVLGAHQLMELVYQMVSRNDAETRRILDDVIILAVHANPDGMELVSEWYMREPEPERRSTRGIPRLYQKYIGHDNNRDFYMVTQPETENMARVMFREWFPQIVYNHHQTGPDGTVMFAPPFRDPFNYNYDPLIPLGIEMVGAAMHSRFVAEGKPGTTMRSGATYSTWWNGGLRTTAYFHNMIGLLTETIGNPTPIEIPLVLDRQLPHNDLAYPIEPQMWHFRQSIEYSITANRAVLDYASRYRETVLYRFFLMSRNAIDRGNRDHWTITPPRIDAVRAKAGSAVERQESRRWRSPEIPTELFAELRRPEHRDPRGYILPADQLDFPTAVKFANTLIKTGVTVHRATAPFDIAGTRYPEGSLVVKSAQAFRAHVLDMFEPQHHPNDFAYPGGPPTPPYDNAGWTLAYQMGIAFDRILDGFEGPFEVVEGFVPTPLGRVVGAAAPTGYLISHHYNDAVVLTNRVLASGGQVFWLAEATAVNGSTYGPGTIYVSADGVSRDDLTQWIRELGLTAAGVSQQPTVDAWAIRPARLALWDRYGGSMPSGWTRWLLEQFEFPYEVAYPKTLNEGDLSEFDVIVLPDGAMGAPRVPQSVPERYRDRVGRLSIQETGPRLRAFLEEGGSVIAIGSATDIGPAVGVPVTDHLVDSSGEPLSRADYYVPGSVLRTRADTTRPVAFGVNAALDVMFSNSPVFRLTEEAPGVYPVLTFATNQPLRSGWAWGQERLEGGVTGVEAHIGAGTVYLFGPEILYRGQPHGTFKLFFNGIHLTNAQLTRLGGDAAGRP